VASGVQRLQAAHAHAHSHAHAHAHAYRHAAPPGRALTYTRTYTRTCTRTCTRTHSRTHIHTHTHIQTHRPSHPTAQCLELSWSSRRCAYMHACIHTYVGTVAGARGDARQYGRPLAPPGSSVQCRRPIARTRRCPREALTTGVKTGCPYERLAHSNRRLALLRGELGCITSHTAWHART